MFPEGQTRIELDTQTDELRDWLGKRDATLY